MPRFAGRQPAHGLEIVASFAVIAAELGCSKARAQKIGAQALAKLRVLLTERGCSVDDLIEAGMRAGPRTARATMAR